MVDFRFRELSEGGLTAGHAAIRGGSHYRLSLSLMSMS
jgi:hypothetical protein